MVTGVDYSGMDHIYETPDGENLTLVGRSLI